MKAIIGMDTVIKQAENLIGNNLDGEVILLNIQRGKYYGMQRVASRIWELVVQPRRVSEMCDRLMDEFDVDRPTCEQDVLEFLGELANENLIEVVDAPVK